MIHTRRGFLARFGAGLGAGLVGAAFSAKAGANTPDAPSIAILASRLTQGGWARGQAAIDLVLELDGTPLQTDEQGHFFLAFDRDCGPSVTLTGHCPGGGSTSLPLSIAPCAWNIEHIDAARRPGGPTEAFMKIREPELARIEAARKIETDSHGWRQDFIWPVTGRISGRFGSQRIYRGEPGSYHSGIDITTGTSGTPFVAPADGLVILAARTPFTLEGHLLMIAHGQGLNSAFLHCSEILVNEGDRVTQGQPIGAIGMSGRATGPHLHWGIKWREARLDPLLFAGPMP